MKITDKINWKQPKYMLPAIIYSPWSPARA